MDEDSFDVTEESLKKFILSQKLETDLSMLLAVLVGVEGSKKKAVLKKSFKESASPRGEKKKLTEVGERNKEGLSLYEFAVIEDSQRRGWFDWSFFTRSSGYLQCFISAVLQHADMKTRFIRSVQPPTSGKFFDDPTLDDPFHTIFEGLHLYFTHQSQREDDPKLLAGLSLINVWDIENASKGVKLVLSMLAEKLKHSLVLLGQNLVEQVKTPNDDDCLEMLRFAHLAKDEDAVRPGACVAVGLVTPSQMPTEEEIAELVPMLKS